MRIDTARVADLSPTERDELRALTAAVYPPEDSASPPGTPVTWAAATWSIRVREDDGRLVAQVGMLTREAEINGARTLLGGIGGVKTHPKARGRGHAAAAMRTAATFLADECGVAFLLLVCLPPTVSYYERLGWRRFHGTLLVEQPGGTIPFTANLPMTLPGRDNAPLDGTINLCGQPW